MFYTTCILQSSTLLITAISSNNSVSHCNSSHWGFRRSYQGGDVTIVKMQKKVFWANDHSQWCKWNQISQPVRLPLADDCVIQYFSTLLAPVKYLKQRYFWSRGCETIFIQIATFKYWLNMFCYTKIIQSIKIILTFFPRQKPSYYVVL